MGQSVKVSSHFWSALFRIRSTTDQLSLPYRLEQDPSGIIGGIMEYIQSYIALNKQPNQYIPRTCVGET